MGKSLIIKGGNFATNGIPDLSQYDDISANIETSGGGREYLHYPNNNQSETFLYSSGLPHLHICTIDVSSYVGKKMRLYCSDNRSASYYTGGAYFKCFASAVSVTLPWTGNTTTKNVVTAVEHIDSNGNLLSPAIYDLTVPAGAVYLIFTNDDSVVANPKVYVESD